MISTTSLKYKFHINKDNILLSFYRDSLSLIDKDNFLTLMHLYFIQQFLFYLQKLKSIIYILRSFNLSILCSCNDKEGKFINLIFKKTLKDTHISSQLQTAKVFYYKLHSQDYYQLSINYMQINYFDKFSKIHDSKLFYLLYQHNYLDIHIYKVHLLEILMFFQ